MLQINQIITYANGTLSVYTGKIVKIVSKTQLVVIDPTNAAEVELWKAGYAVGACISPSQIIK